MNTDWIALLLLSGAALLALVDLMEMPGVDDDAPLRRIDDVTSAATLEFWAQVYAANHFTARITFQQFMTNPRGYLAVLQFPPDNDDPLQLLPLLPKQRIVQEHVLLDELRADEEAVLEEAHLRRLQLAYGEISTNSGRLYAPMHRARRTRKYQTRGNNLSHKFA